MKFNMKEIYLILLRLLSKVAQIESHALQVAYIAKKIGEDIGFSSKRLNTLGFLHDIGLLNPNKVNWMQRTHGIENATMTDWIALDNDLHENHSVVGARILSHIKGLSYFADVIEKHHYQAMILDPENDHDVMAGIIHLADTVSVGLLMNTPGAEYVTRIKNIIASSDEFLEPVRESFNRLSSRKGFWWSSTDRDTLFDEFSSDLEENPLNNVDLQAVGDVLMYMVDVKSSFTMNHTERISYLSRLLAERIHLGQERALEVFFAAKIHDLGKMATPISILEKPGKLSGEELYIMQKHVFDSFLIVGGREAIEKHRLLEWGVDHHERLDGSGYPWGKKGYELGIESRIIMIADVFVALTEDRPYRKGLSIKESLNVIGRQVEQGMLDDYVFEKLKDLIDEGLDFSKVERTRNPFLP
ncbi:MAG: HD domain-containing phosphohydrolase [Mesotoga sp.]|nr:HD domain-containing protein [Mesotoga sp.]HPI17924.1 HD domain-containing protein [Mesotoga sp.]